MAPWPAQVDKPQRYDVNSSMLKGGLKRSPQHRVRTPRGVRVMAREMEYHTPGVFSCNEMIIVLAILCKPRKQTDRNARSNMFVPSVSQSSRLPKGSTVDVVGGLLLLLTWPRID